MYDLLRLLTLPKGVARGFKFSIGGLRHHGNFLNPPTSWTSPSLLNGASPLRLANRKIHASSEQWFTQDRVGTDGRLRPSGMRPTAPPTTTSPSSTYVIGTPLPGRSTTPPAAPLSRDALEQLVEFVGDSSGGVLVITGAGCSTESNVPDYRSPGGAYSTGYKPMTHQAFMSSGLNQSRYWARSFAGWHRFRSVKPNAAHEGIARLQRLGWVDQVITQNVDRLHQSAGSSAVLELHGTTHEVICMSCRNLMGRDEMQRLLAELNPGAAAAAENLATARDDAQEQERMLRAGTAEPVSSNFKETKSIGVRPDGDVDLPTSLNFTDTATTSHLRQRPDGDIDVALDTSTFKVPPCPCCGGVLKPDVVFFGDSLPPERAERSLELARTAPSVVVVGSSLAVWSAFRLVKTAKENGAKVAIVNVGPTRADGLSDLTVEALAGEVLIQLAASPALLIPRAN